MAQPTRSVYGVRPIAKIMKTDVIFYQLFKEFPHIFFELIGKPETNIAAYQFDAPSVKQRSFSLDGVFSTVPGCDTEPLYFLEVQCYEDDNFYDRLFPEIFLYFGQYQPKNSDWYAIVIYDRASHDSTIPERYRHLSQFHLQRIYLDEIDSEADEFLGIGILKLIVDSPTKVKKRAPKLVRKTYDRFADPIERDNVLEWIETIVTYQFPALSQREVKKMLQLEELKQTRVYQEGLEQGLEQGEQQGRQAAKLEMVPVLRELGLSAEQIADRLQLDLELVRSTLKQKT